jgi:energy-coupling factor transporter ATP-binding protein EcfA2
MTQQDIINENIIKQYEIRVLQDEAKINALETALVKMAQFIPVDERELFLHTLSSEEMRRLEVAEIIAMIRKPKSL